MKKSLSIDQFQVLRAVKGTLYLAGEPMTEIEVQNLKQEVRALKNFRVWQIMHETVRQAALDKGFYEATEWEHTLSGKMMVHNLGILKNIVDIIDKYTIPQMAAPKRKSGIPLP